MLVFAFSAAADIGQIKTLEGGGHILRGDDRIVAEPGMRLEAADTVLTSEDSRMGIIFIDDTRLSLGPNSRIELERFHFDPAKNDGEFFTRIKSGSLEIISGKIAKQSPDSMKVATPTSVLAVRGTRFLIKIEE